MMIAAPRVNVAAWFGLAVAVPAILLGLAAAGTSFGLTRSAGFCAAMLLAPAVVLALRSLETRRFQDNPMPQREQDLVRAFCLTTGQACGLLFVVLAGARFSGEAVAVGLAMAGVPLTLAVASDLWRRIFPPLEIPHMAATQRELAATAHQWTVPWPEHERRRASAPAPQPAVAEPIRVQAAAIDHLANWEELERMARERLLRAIGAEAEILHEASLAPAEDEPRRAPLPETLEERLERELGPRVRLAFEQGGPLAPLPLKSRPAELPVAPEGVVRRFQPVRLWASTPDSQPRRAAAGG